MAKRKKWTKEEIFILKQYYGVIHYTEIAKILNRSPNAVKVKAHKLKLKSDLPRGRKPLLLKQHIETY